MVPGGTRPIDLSAHIDGQGGGGKGAGDQNLQDEIIADRQCQAVWL